MAQDDMLIEPLSAEQIKTARAGVDQLTPRERQVVRAMGNGLTAAETAAALAIAEKTVDLHRANVFRKLGVNSALLAVRVAIAMRLAVIAAANLNIDWTTPPLIS